jgi:hypothetical protein
MAFFKVGDVYRQKYLIESVVPFFQGELAIAVYEDKRYYLQSASLNRQAPLRAISQYRNLKSPQVIPYLDVFDEPDMLVFIRPYVEIRPLREIITTQELSEEQVVKWVRSLLHVEAVLRSKPMSMYLLLDLRNIGVDSQNELKVFFCGLEQIMVYESKLDWGTFIYSMLSGQFLDGPILRLPRNFKVSRPMSRLIQKSFKEYTVPPVLEQVEIFENKNTSGGILSKFWGEKKEESNGLMVPHSKQKQESVVSLSNRPIYRTEQNSGVSTHQGSGSTTVFTDDQGEEETKHRVVIQERGSLVKEDETKDLNNKTQTDQQKSSITTAFKEDTDESNLVEINDADQETISNTEWSLDEEEPLVGAKDQLSYNNEGKVVYEPQVSHPSNSNDKEVSFTVFPIESNEAVISSEGVTETEQQETEPKSEDIIALEHSEDKPLINESLEEQEDKKETVKEESRKTHPDANQTTVTVSPALAQSEGQDLSQSFVLKLNMQQEELEKEQEERLKKMREEYERRERELIEQHRKKLEEEQRRLLEEQRKKLEQQQEELLRLKREELARLEKEAQLAKERKEKEARRKAKLAEARKQFEEKQKLMLEQEELAFQKRQEELLKQLHTEYEQRKTNLLQQQEKEYQARTKAKLAELTAEWEQVEASTHEDNPNEIKFETITNQVTEESEKSKGEAPQIVYQTSVDLGKTSIPADNSKSINSEIKTNTESVEEPITEAENEEIESVFAEVIPVKEPEPKKEIKKDPKVSNEYIEAEEVTKSEVKLEMDKQEQKKKVDETPEAVFGKPEKVESQEELSDSTQTDEKTEEKVEGETSEIEGDEESSSEEAPKKKRRRRRRRKKKKSDGAEGTSTEEVTASPTDLTEEIQNSLKVIKNTTKEVDPLEAERQRRELELQQMERELLEMEKQEAQSKPKVQAQEPPKVNKVQEESAPKKEEKKPSPQSPVVAKKPEVPVVKDTTEHATLAKQFEQYLKLFKRKK